MKKYQRFADVFDLIIFPTGKRRVIALIPTLDVLLGRNMKKIGTVGCENVATMAEI